MPTHIHFTGGTSITVETNFETVCATLSDTPRGVVSFMAADGGQSVEVAVNPANVTYVWPNVVHSG